MKTYFEGDNLLTLDGKWLGTDQVGPLAAFGFTPNGGQEPLPVSFTDNSVLGSSPIVEWLWDFGDGTTSLQQNPNHTYQFDGTYVISLQVKDENGLISTATQNIAVTDAGVVGPTASFSLDVNTGDAPLTVTAESTSTQGDANITQHFWEWGDGNSTPSGTLVSYNYQNPGMYTLRLTLTDADGLTSTTTQQVTVNTPPDSPPDPQFSMSPAGGVFPIDITFDASASTDDGNIIRYDWDFGDGNTGSGQIVTHNYTAAGPYTVELTVEDDTGNIRSLQKIINISAPGAGEQNVGVVHEVLADNFDLGFQSQSQIQTNGDFEFVTKGADNGYQGRRLMEVVDDPAGQPISGRWFRLIRPGGLDAHTFTKAFRAVTQNASGSYDTLYTKLEMFIGPDWVTQNQGKPGYSWSNPNGTSPGTNPTSAFELLYHFFSPNHQKNPGLWPTTKPNSAPYTEQDFVMGADCYLADPRVNTNFSEPVFFAEDPDNGDFTQALFGLNQHLVFWIFAKLNNVGQSDGILKGWYSRDGGQNFKRSINIDDVLWRTDSREFQDYGMTDFYGGSGFGFEPGGGPSKNTGVTLTSQDYWKWHKHMKSQTGNPFPGLFA